MTYQSPMKRSRSTLSSVGNGGWDWHPAWIRNTAGSASSAAPMDFFRLMPSWMPDPTRSVAALR